MKLEDIDILAVGHTIQLAGTIWADGDQVVYIAPLPGALTDKQLDALGTAERSIGDMVQPFIQLLDMDLPDWKRFLRQTDLLEVEIFEATGDNRKVAKAIVRKSARQIAQGVSWNVYRRDGYCCRYCGADDVPLNVDHLVLWEHMGPSIEGNLVATCRKCNKVRGNTEYADWLNHQHYKRMSARLTPEQRQANIDLLPTLDSIPRRVHGSKR